MAVGDGRRDGGVSGTVFNVKGGGYVGGMPVEAEDEDDGRILTIKPAVSVD